MIKPGNIKKQQIKRSDDLQDIMIAESRSEEKSVPFETVVKKLRKKGKFKCVKDSSEKPGVSFLFVVLRLSVRMTNKKEMRTCNE